MKIPVQKKDKKKINQKEAELEQSKVEDGSFESSVEIEPEAEGAAREQSDDGFSNSSGGNHEIPEMKSEVEEIIKAMEQLWGKMIKDLRKHIPEDE